MKNFLICAGLCIPLAIGFSGCKKSVDYFEYVSENRKSYYFYQDDDVTLKIYSVDKETPYCLDGVCGDVSCLTEIYYSSEKTANEVEIELCGKGGEMSYMSVTRNYYLSFGEVLPDGASIPVKLTVDGNVKEYDVQSVAEEGVIDGKTALKCVYEYDSARFEALTEHGNFKGEILLRLLYDEGCYYYVGICDRDKNLHAYLVDGTDGRIIAERDAQA